MQVAYSRCDLQAVDLTLFSWRVQFDRVSQALALRDLRWSVRYSTTIDFHSRLHVYATQAASAAANFLQQHNMNLDLRCELEESALMFGPGNQRVVLCTPHARLCLTTRSRY